MADHGLSGNELPAAPLDDNTDTVTRDVITQHFESIPAFDMEAKAIDSPPNPHQILNFESNRSLSSMDEVIDLEVTTQVLDTLDALDMAESAFPPASSPKMEVEELESKDATNTALSSSDSGPKRSLPGWMTEAPPPVVTRRSLYLNTQARHRKKQILLDEEELADTTAPKYPYTDAMRPSELNLECVICFDVESTGFASTDGIIEIGAVEYIYGQRTGAMFQSYIKPSVPVNAHAAEVHGLTNVMLASAPPASIIIPSFLAWVGSSPLVAHNARFDMRMLLQEAKQLGIEESLDDKPVFCTMRCHRKLYPGLPASLIDVYTNLLGAERYASNSQICNPKLPNHSAIVDAEILGEVFLKLSEEALSKLTLPKVS